MINRRCAVLILKFTPDDYVYPSQHIIVDRGLDSSGVVDDLGY